MIFVSEFCGCEVSYLNDDSVGYSTLCKKRPSGGAGLDVSRSLSELASKFLRSSSGRRVRAISTIVPTRYLTIW